MKKEEAIEALKIMIGQVEWDYPMDYATAIDIAIEALEKQIPKKPVLGYAYPEKLRHVMYNNGDYEKGMHKTDCCPACERPLGISKFVQTLSGSKFGDLYCKHCGQAIEWMEDEE